jgi:nucleoid-associated protein YgaU
MPREPAVEPVAEAPDEVEDPDAITEPGTEPIAIAAPPAADPTATTEAAAPEGIGVDTAERARRDRPVERAKPAVQPRVVVAAPAPVVAPAPPQTATVLVVAGTNQNKVAEAKSGDRFHVVQRGESLWSIATDLLGEGASTTQIAREVDRLWELNEDRIASGNPDLLYTGARLRLR